ncbi:helix-turn-helix domain-containing protein [Kitasatospora azatica]|uniref:helix-turn-helix domain-containing protein n=1 Tax=Kitasatospora azatica TaxID=58347 RepID=UPI0012FADFA6|nr:helix-turn-helix transcriptional regulator [Kitasatospora azatica]
MENAQQRCCTGCGALLSRFNQRRQCALCERSMAPKADAAFWAEPEVLGALRRWDFGAVVRLYRRHTGLPQAAVARLVGIDQAEVSRLENGRKTIRDRHQLQQWAKGLGIPPALIAPLPAESAALVPVRAQHRRAPEEAATAGIWDDPAVIADQLSAITSVNVDTAALSQFARSVDSIVMSYETGGPQSLAPVGAQLRSSLHTLLSGRQHPGQRQKLYVLAAQAAGLLGYMAVNAGRPAAAKAYCAEAFQLAEEVQDVDLMAWVRGTQSLEAYYAGQYREAYDLADAGVRLAVGSPQAVRLLVNGKARALGKLHERRAAERAIGEALALTERVGTPLGLTPCISFEPYGLARTLANAATVHMALGDTPKVLSYADQVAQHVQEADSAWSRALIALDVAASHLHGPNPEVEQSMDLGRAALHSGGANPIRSVVQRAAELQQLAAPWSHLDAVVEYGVALAQWRVQKAAYIVEA